MKSPRRGPQKWWDLMSCRKTVEIRNSFWAYAYVKCYRYHLLLHLLLLHTHTHARVECLSKQCQLSITTHQSHLITCQETPFSIQSTKIFVKCWLLFFLLLQFGLPKDFSYFTRNSYFNTCIEMLTQAYILI